MKHDSLSLLQERHGSHVAVSRHARPAGSRGSKGNDPGSEGSASTTSSTHAHERTSATHAQAWPASSGTPSLPRATATPQGAGHDAARPASLLPPQRLPQRIGPSSAPPASRQGPALAGAPSWPDVLTDSVALAAAAHTLRRTRSSHEHATFLCTFI